MTSKLDCAWNSTARKINKNQPKLQIIHMQCHNIQCLTVMNIHSDIICVVICSKRHSLRHMGKCEVFSSSHSLQAIPVPIPVGFRMGFPWDQWDPWNSQYRLISSFHTAYSRGRSADFDAQYVDIRVSAQWCSFWGLENNTQYLDPPFREKPPFLELFLTGRKIFDRKPLYNREVQEATALNCHATRI